MAAFGLVELFLREALSSYPLGKVGVVGFRMPFRIIKGDSRSPLVRDYFLRYF